MQSQSISIASVASIASISIASISDIKHIVYINLAMRPDRKAHIESQLKQVGFAQYERFNAFKLTNGRIGCSMSHIKCLENAQAGGYSHLLICEDDTTFLQPALFKTQLNKFLATGRQWDVVLFAGNNVPPYERIDDTCVRVSRCQTTTCYLVNGAYFATLIANMKEGLQKLLQEPSNHFNYAIDKYWIILQQQHKWFIITPLTVVQRDDYSDIEQQQTNYMKMMVDLDKPHLFVNHRPTQKKGLVHNI